MKYSLKELRARNNLTQPQVAELLGISVTTYLSWERDINKFKKTSIYNYYKLADIFGVKITDIKLEKGGCKNESCY